MDSGAPWDHHLRLNLATRARGPVQASVAADNRHAGAPFHVLDSTILPRINQSALIRSVFEKPISTHILLEQGYAEKQVP